MCLGESRFIFDVFQVSSKDEDFLDLSVDVEQNTSITHCLRYVVLLVIRLMFHRKTLEIDELPLCLLNRGFSNTETLCSEHKYFCEQCRSKQEAQKRLVIFSLSLTLRDIYLKQCYSFKLIL